MKTILFLVLCVWCVAGHAATYYVTQSGAGSADGSSLGNAWSVSNYNGSSAPGGGDTVEFSGTITSTVSVNTDGTSAGTRLTLDFTAATLNTADPRIDLNGHDYLNLLGGTFGSASSGSLIDAGNSVCNYITISGWTHTGTSTSTARFMWGRYLQNAILTDNTLDQVSNYVFADTTNSHDITVSKSYVRTSLNETVQTDIVAFGDAYNVTIEGNHFIMRTEGANSGRHNDIIQNYQGGGSSNGNPSNWIIRYNWLELDVDGGSGDNSWLMLEHMAGQPALRCYGNVFVGITGTAGNNGIRVTNGNASGDTYYFYNNTIVPHGGPGNVFRPASPGTVFLRNNVGQAPSSMSTTFFQIGMSEGGGGAGWDYNYWRFFDGSSATQAGPNGSTNTDPLFVDFANDDVTTQSGSPLRAGGDATIGAEYGNGIAYGAVWPSMSGPGDVLTTLVERGETWDIGAYQYSSGSAPDAPSDLTAGTQSAARIDLDWTDNADNEIGFRIERKIGAGSFVEIATVGAGVTTYSDTGLNAVTLHTYRVRAYNATGNSSYTTEASDTTEEAPSADPVLRGANFRTLF